MGNWRLQLKIWTAAAISAAWVSAAAAELSMPIAARVVSFSQPTPSGSLLAAIIFQPGNSLSEADATSIERAVGGAHVAGRISIHTRRVSIDALGELSGVRIAFVTTGLKGDYDAIAAAGARGSILTITNDDACVRAGACVVGIASSPRVQITVSRRGAQAAKIRFGSAFLMLVKEL